ncbi:MAG: response regulator [Magnetococcus sp. YQC-5]
MSLIRIRSWPLLILLVIPFTLLIFMAGGLSGYISYITGQQSVQELTQRLMTETSGRIQAYIQAFFKTPPSLVSLNANMIQAHLHGDQSLIEIERVFFYQVRDFQVRSVYFGDEQGRGAAVFRENDGSFQARVIQDPPKRLFFPLDNHGKRLPQIRETTWDPRQRPWYTGAMQQNRPVWSPVYTFTDGVLGITVSHAYHKPDPVSQEIQSPERSVQGVIGVDLDLQFISNFLRSLAISPSGQAFILEPTGAIMAVSTQDPLSLQVPNQEPLQRMTWDKIQNPTIRETVLATRQQFGQTMNMTQPHSMTLNINHEPTDIRLTPIRDEYGLDLIVGVAIPQHDFMAAIATNARHSFQLTLVMLILAIVLGVLFSRSIARPIRQLADASKKMAVGDYQQTVDIKWSQELIILSQAFSIMAQQVGHTIKALEALNTELETRVSERTADLAAAKLKAEAATRSKSQFLANMSHEIRSPMNAIIGMTDLVLQNNVPTEHREYLKIVQSSSESLLSLINSILDFSKIEAGKLEIDPIDFNLRTLLEESADALAITAAKKGLELLHVMDPRIPEELTGDSLRLRQILINLVNNAIKFTSTGEIVIRVTPLPQPATTEQSVTQTVTLHFTVSDSGIGIPKDKLMTIFEDFSQADATTTRKFGGTGLGLTISKRLVELMGGSIWVESEMGKGSVFHVQITLPVRRAPEALSQATPLPDLRDIRILLAEPNETVRRALVDLLSQMGVSLTMTENSMEFIQSYQNATHNHSPYAVALINSQQPDLGGIELVKRVQKDPEWFGKFIVMLSATHRLDDKHAFLQLGVVEILKKPIKKRPLMHAILRAIGRETLLPAEEKITQRIVKSTNRKLNILVADDQRINQKLVVDSLTRAGHHTLTALHGAKVLEILAANPIDLILMDVQMPEMDGLQATKAIRAGQVPNINPHLPIVAVTANAMTEDRQQCLDAGMDDYLSKPFKPAELLELVERTAIRFGLGTPARAETPEWLRKKMFRKPELLQSIRETDVDILAKRRSFLTNTRSDINSLQTAFKDHDSPRATEHARKIKEAADAIGAAELKNASFKLILALRNTDNEQSKRSFDHFMTEWARLSATLQAETNTTPTEQTP